MVFPLWLPEGSVRAVLALIVVGSAIVAVFTLPVESAALLLALAGVVFSSYFRAREVLQRVPPSFSDALAASQAIKR